MFLRRGLVSGVVLLAAALAGYAALKYTETAVSTYATYADAVRDGARERGWLPAFVPPDAFAIREVHDRDTNEQWIRFSAPTRGFATVLEQGAPDSVREHAAAAPRAPAVARGVAGGAFAVIPSTRIAGLSGSRRRGRPAMVHRGRPEGADRVRVELLNDGQA